MSEKNNPISNKNRNINKQNNETSTQNTQTVGIKFMEDYIGNYTDDPHSKEHFINQKYLIRNNTTKYQEDINYNNKLRKNRHENDEYNKLESDKLRMTDYRINASQTIIDNKNLSNPLIYPEYYDEYFEYLAKKSITPINNRVVVIDRIFNLDSNNATQTQDKTEQNIPLNDNSLQFTDGSDRLKIHFDNSNGTLETDDLISLSGVSNSSVTISNLHFNFEIGSSTVIIDTNPNFTELINFIPVYINFKLITNDSYFQNIPIQILNRTYKINISEYNGQPRMSIKIPILFYSESVYNTTLVSTTTLTLFNVGNYPTNLLNTSSDTESQENALLPFFNVNHSTDKYIEIVLKGNVSVNNNFLTGIEDGNSFYTGKNLTMNKIMFDNNNSLNNEYYFELGKNVTNICLMTIESSELPNINYNINSSNNKFYWNNLADSTLYSITLDVGNYSYPELKKEMEEQISKVKKTNILVDLQYEYNIIEVNFNESNETSSFKSFNLFYFVKPFKKIKPIYEDNNSFGIEIFHPNHNLDVGDRIFISNSIDYFTIDASYINNTSGHVINKVINKDLYLIIINNVNEISDVGDTGGGNSIKLRSPNSISLNFSFDNTFGALMGFSNPGSQFSVTPFSSSSNDYTITNKQQYSYDISGTLIVNKINSPEKFFKNNYSNYILLKINTYNDKIQTGTKDLYFYKFQTPRINKDYIFNSFINEPIIFDPPLPNMSSLCLSWIYPDGSDVNFYGKDFSLSIKITKINNLPKNTDLNSNISRI